MAPKKGIKVNTDKKNDKKTTKKQNNGSSKMKKSGGVVASTAATTAASTRPLTARPLKAASTRPLTARPLTAASTRPLTARPLKAASVRPTTAASARPTTAATLGASARPTTAASRPSKAAATTAASYTNNQLNNGDPPLPPGGGTYISFDFYCDNNETTKDMCNGTDGTDLEATSSRLQQIIQQVINELLAAPDALPPLNILMTQILVSFVVDMIQNALQKEQRINPTDKNIENLFKMASNIVLTSLVTTGQVPSASTIVIRVLVKRSMLDQKNAPSLPAMGKKITLATIKEAKKLIDKLDASEIKNIINTNTQQPINPLTIQGVQAKMDGSRPKTRTGGRKSRRGN